MISITKRNLIVATLIGFVFSTFANFAPVYAVSECNIPDKDDPKVCLDDYFGSNDILFYDPNADECEAPSATSGNGALVGNDNAEKIFTFLVGKGLDPAQAAGFLGNMQQESGFNPAIRQGGAIAPDDFVPVHNEGFGIVQWTHGATTPGTRQGDLYALAKTTSRNITDLGLQLDYVWVELNGGWKITLDKLQGVTDPVEAAVIVHDHYEISADTPQEVRDIRGGNAKGFYDKYKGLAPNTSTTPGTSSCTEATEENTGSTNFMDDNFTLYTQCNTQPTGGSWGDRTTVDEMTVCSAGAVPTALAIVARNITGAAVTPNSTVDHFIKYKLWYPDGGAMVSGLGTSAETFGMSATVLRDKGDIAAYREVFAKGGLVTVSSRGTAPFLPLGHTIVLRGITPDNNFMIADPGYEHTNIAPDNQISVDKILTDIRSDSGSLSYAFYKK